ncbi:MAG: chorismate synthase [Candidatus Cloacimonetes bacterium]|nr:chorismate synthase [Candidatus Cloacimonadota bacterium]
MKSNSFGKYFGFTAFGESHGHSMGLVIEDVLPGIDFPFSELKTALEKRKPGKDSLTSTRQEDDDFKVISGIFQGKTTGMPICILFKNKDVRSEDYENLQNVFRPSHADFSWFQKFKIYDYRGGGRASGRETISRVAAGAIVKNVLGEIQIKSYPIKIGNIKAIYNYHQEEFISTNPLNWPCPKTYDEIVNLLNQTKNELDSLGAIVEVRISNIPAGLGDPVFEKLDANIAKAIMSIGGVRGIEFGSGFELSEMRGSESNFSIHQGGILGGVSTGEIIKMRIVVKPVSSIGKPQYLGESGQTIAIKGRHDICLVPRILPVIESMIQLVLADAIAYQNLISLKEKDLNGYREALDKIDEDILIAFYRRFELVHIIGNYKENNEIAILDNNREKEILENMSVFGEKMGISEDFVIKIWSLILEESKKRQVERRKKGKG